MRCCRDGAEYPLTPLTRDEIEQVLSANTWQAPLTLACSKRGSPSSLWITRMGNCSSNGSTMRLTLRRCLPQTAEKRLALVAIRHWTGGSDRRTYR
jgi:hypothetical protein